MMLWLAAGQPDSPAPLAPVPAAAPAAGEAPRAPNLDDPVVAPDGPPSSADQSYRNRILSNFQVSQGRQGPYDGRWRVSGSSGDMFILQLSDPGDGDGQIEGAWSDVRRGGPGHSGLIDSVTHEGDALVLRFSDGDPHHQTEVRLRSPQVGGWLGEVTTPESGRQTIVMHRAESLEAAARAAPYVEPPPRAQATKAKARPSPKQAKAKKGRKASARAHGRATAKSHSPKKQGSASSKAKSKAKSKKKK